LCDRLAWSVLCGLERPEGSAGHGRGADRPDQAADPAAAVHGAVNQTLAGSQPDWGQIGHIRPPEGAPNVLLVLIDDAGFGNPSTFGGPVDTPNYTRMADQGLRYNRFHVTALCSPTRAALLTGRNHHTVGFGSIGELSSGFPGYTAFVPKDCAPLPQDLAGERLFDGGHRQVAHDP
jgi:arylsulfatase